MATRSSFPMWIRSPNLIRHALTLRGAGESQTKIAVSIGVKPKTFTHSIGRLRAICRGADWVKYGTDEQELAMAFIEAWDRIAPMPRERHLQNGLGASLAAVAEFSEGGE